MSGDRHVDPAVEARAIRADIEATRERLGDSVEQLAARLNPREVKARIKHGIHEATIGKVKHMAKNTAGRVGDAGRGVVDVVRENPMPAALIAVGLGWLLWGARKGRAETDITRRKTLELEPATDEMIRYEGGWTDDGVTARPETSYRMESSFAAADAAGATGSKVERAKEKAGEIAAATKEKAGEIATATKEKVTGAASAVAETTRHQAERVKRGIEEQPLMLGAVALVAGLAAGLAVPATDAEARLVGDARDRMVDKGKERFIETKEKVQHVASRVMEDAKTSATQAAREEGLTA